MLVFLSFFLQLNKNMLNNKTKTTYQEVGPKRAYINQNKYLNNIHLKDLFNLIQDLGMCYFHLLHHKNNIA